MTWEKIWMSLFGTTQWLGLDMGFWVSMGIVTLLVVIMNVVFWGMKPKRNNASNKNIASKH